MKMMTVEEVSEILNMEVVTIRRYIAAKKLKAYKIGKEWRVKKEDLDEFINQESNLDN